MEKRTRFLVDKYMTLRVAKCGNCTNYNYCRKGLIITLATKGCEKHIFISEEKEIAREKRSKAAYKNKKHKLVCSVCGSTFWHQQPSVLFCDNCRKPHICACGRGPNSTCLSMVKTPGLMYAPGHTPVSEETREKLRQSGKTQLSRMSEEAVEQWKEKEHIAQIKFWEDKTEEYRKQHGELISIGHANRPEEAKKVTSELISQRSHEAYDSMTDEDKLNKSKKISVSLKSKPQEEKDRIYKVCTIKRLETIANKTEEELKITSSKLRESAVRRLRDPNDKLGNRKLKRTMYKNVNMRSKMEVAFAKACDDLGITWLYEPTYFYLEDIDKGYTPDFYLPELNRYIEIKPSYFLNKPPINIPKLRGVRKLGNTICFVSDKNWYLFLSKINKESIKACKENKCSQAC